MNRNCKNNARLTDRVIEETNVTVEHHHAPTDESIRLLNEMQEAARKNIISQVVIESNVAKCVAIYFHNHTEDRSIIIYIRFILNDKEYILREYIQEREIDGIAFPREDIHKRVFELFHKKISECIAAELMMGNRDFLMQLSKIQ